MSIQQITFNNDKEFMRALNLITVRNQPATLESCVPRKANKNSRSKNKPVFKDGKPVMVKVKDSDEKVQKMAKTPFTEVFKGQIFSTKREYVRIMSKYSAVVNNQRKREGNFEEFNEGELPFGEWVDGMFDIVIFNEKSGLHHLRYYQDRNANYKYSSFRLHYADGTELTDAEIALYWAEYAPPKSKNPKQEIEKPCLPRSPKFQNVVKLVADKVAIIREGFSNENSFNEIIEWHTAKMANDNTL